jgi:hypothetical protein
VHALCAAGMSFWLLFYVVPPIMIGADYEITTLHFEGTRKALKYETCSPKYPENIRIPQIAINEEPSSTSRHVNFLVFRKTEQFKSKVCFPNGSSGYWHSCEISSDREWHIALFSVPTYFACNPIAIDESCSISEIFDIEVNLHDPIGTFECILRQQQFWLMGDQIRPFGIAHNASLLRRGSCGGRSGIGRFLGYRDGLLRMASVGLRDPPQAIGRPPEGARENCRGDDGESSDCIVVKPRPEPMPTSDDQQNKQGTNGLILIAGIAVALLIAFRRKPPPFHSERRRHESDNAESG